MRYIVGPVLLVLFIFTGSICFGSEAMLQKAWTYYLDSDYKRAVDVCRVVSKNKILGEEGRYIMGLSFLKLGDNKEARKNFSFVLDNYPKSGIKEDLFLGIADSYYLEKKFDNAEEYYVKLLRSFPSTGYTSMAYLRLGESQRKQGKWEKADASFSKVVREYPLSLEAGRAKGFLKKKVSFFSIQAGAFSKKANAQKFCELLKKKSHKAYIDKIYKKDRLIYRVRVGKFRSRDKAQGEAGILKGEGFNVRICT